MRLGADVTTLALRGAGTKNNVTSRMSEPTSFPRFIFIGQVYYYLFWYRIMATDGPADTQFWGMLILMVFPRMVAAHAGA